MDKRTYMISIKKKAPRYFMGIIKKKDEFFVCMSSPDVVLDEKYRLGTLYDLTLNEAFEAMGLSKVTPRQEYKIEKFVTETGTINKVADLEEGVLHVEISNRYDVPVFNPNPKPNGNHFYYGINTLNYEAKHHKTTHKVTHKAHKKENALEK